jgi:hypothetical protein
MHGNFDDYIGTIENESVDLTKIQVLIEKLMLLHNIFIAS